jgi:ABC-type proline/glycine betaine transport system substrate-binding protein
MAHSARFFSKMPDIPVTGGHDAYQAGRPPDVEYSSEDVVIQEIWKMIARLRTVILMALFLVAAAPETVSAEAIRIAVNEATSQRVIARITGEALKEAGFAIEYVEVAAATQYSMIATGDLHVQPDATDTTDNADYQSALATGKIVDLGQRATERGDSRSRKIMWTGVNGKWPGAAKLLRNMSLSSEDQNAMAMAIDGEGRDIDEVVEEWMSANSKRWKLWTAASTNWMKQ